MSVVNPGPMGARCPPMLYCYVCNMCMHQWHHNGQKAVMMLKHMEKHQKKRAEMVGRLTKQLQNAKREMYRQAALGRMKVAADIAEEIKQENALLVRWERLPLL